MNSAPEKRMRELVDQFTILLAAIRALLRNKEARLTLLDTYDSVSQQIVRGLQSGGFSGEDLMELEKNLARLRLALDEALQ